MILVDQLSGNAVHHPNNLLEIQDMKLYSIRSCSVRNSDFMIKNEQRITSSLTSLCEAEFACFFFFFFCFFYAKSKRSVVILFLLLI